MEIKHLEWLQMQEGEEILYGYNQEWYSTSFQKTRGCGPTAAAMLLLYINLREKGSLPYQKESILEVQKVLEDVWRFITPGWLLGLNSTGKFYRGLEKLFSYYNLPWQCQVVSIPAFTPSRPSLLEVVKFLEAGITSDCPIGFLNLHKGKTKNLESWHWIVLVSLSYDSIKQRYMATCYDNGYSRTFDLSIWLETSKLGGGFVYITTK